MEFFDMNIDKNLNDLLNYKYDFNNYIENKSFLYDFLNKIKKNSGNLNSYKIKELLIAIQPVLKSLRINQDQIRDQIRAQKSNNKSSSILDQLNNKFRRTLVLFKKIIYNNHRLNDLIELTKTIAKENKIEDFRVETSRTERFKKIAQKLVTEIAVGSCTKDAISLDPNYWLETVGMKFTIDGERYEGHVYTGYFAESKYLEKWSTSFDNKGIPYQKQYSFEEYLNQIVIPNMSSKEKDELKAKCSIVEYYSPEELATLEAHIDKEGKIYTETPHLNHWMDHRIKNPNDKQIYSDFLQTDQLTNTNTSTIKNQPLRDGTFMYVLDHLGHLYVQIKNRGKTNHTSLSNGKAVLAAGSLQVKDGKIIAIDTFSGHYKPTELHLANFLTYLKKLHVKLNAIQLTYVSEYGVQPWKILKVSPQDVENWIVDVKAKIQSCR